MLRLYQKAFSIEGFEVTVAGGGEEGLKKVRESIPDLILLDIMMPKMDGFEVLSALKSDPTTQDIKVIVLTNLAGQQDAERAIEEGAVKYIVKSQQDPREVVKEVKEVLQPEFPAP